MSTLTKAEEEALTVTQQDVQQVLGRKAPTNAMDLLAVALSKDAAIDVIERLAALYEKAEARQAEIGFNDAMSRIQSEIKRIAPDLENPQTRSKYASYAALDKVVRPIYSKEGFALSFGTDDCPLPEYVRVICYASRGAYTRRYQIDMPADGKGAKGGDVMTKTHATGAAMSYGMRYLLKNIFNIAVGEEDRDGNSITMGDIAERLEWIANAKDVEELKKLYLQALEPATKANDKNAINALREARGKRYAQLIGATYKKAI